MPLTNADKAARTVKMRAAVCTPRGSHRPEMTKRFMTDAGPAIFRLCADCVSWVDPTLIHAQDTVGGRAASPGFAR